MKVIGQVGDWISLKLDELAKVFITKEDLMEIALQEQRDRINDMTEKLKSLKTARKNLEDLRVSNNKKVKEADEMAKQMLKENKDDIAKLHIKAKLDNTKQNLVLDKSVKVMETKETLMEKTLERLKHILEISADKVEYYKATYSATKSTLKSIDIDLSKRLDMREVMREIEREINSMDNRMEAISEMEEKGIIGGGDETVPDYEVDREFEQYKEKVHGKTRKAKPTEASKTETVKA